MSRDVVEGQVTVKVGAREFAVIGGRRWTRIPEYLSNGQLTARWFMDERSGEVRMARSWKSPQRWPMCGDAAEFVRGIVGRARADTPAGEPVRDWLSIGLRFEAQRDQVEAAIDGLRWQTEKSTAMVPGLAINALIREFRLPKVSRYAVNGTIQAPDPPEGLATYSVYGVEASFSNGRARLYVVDTGSELVPVCADFWPGA